MCIAAINSGIEFVRTQVLWCFEELRERWHTCKKFNKQNSPYALLCGINFRFNAFLIVFSEWYRMLLFHCVKVTWSSMKWMSWQFYVCKFVRFVEESIWNICPHSICEAWSLKLVHVWLLDFLIRTFYLRSDRNKSQKLVTHAFFWR